MTALDIKSLAASVRRQANEDQEATVLTVLDTYHLSTEDRRQVIAELVGIK